MDAQRAMLDELMGKERNVPLTERTGRALKFSDPEICKYNLAGLCPYGLFRNTRSDLGEFDAVQLFSPCGGWARFFGADQSAF